MSRVDAALACSCLAGLPRAALLTGCLGAVPRPLWLCVSADCRWCLPMLSSAACASGNARMID